MDNGERDRPECACTPEWPCVLHGTEGRGVAVPSDIFEEWLRPYKREDEWPRENRWGEPLGPWKPPVELRPADRVPDQGARPAPVAEVPKIAALRQARRDGATRFTVTWTFKDGVKEHEDFQSVGWAERKVAQLKQGEQGVWRTIYRSGQPRRFQDQVEDVQIDAWWARSEQMVECLCGCDEQFVPIRSNQRYLSERHKSRASTRAARARDRM